MQNYSTGLNSSQELYLLLQEQRKRQLEASLAQFTRDAFEVLDPAEVFVPNWHIDFICNKIQLAIDRVGKRQFRDKHLCINIPPRSLKSISATICSNAWGWIKYPHLKFIATSYSGDLSLEHNIKTKDLVESDWYSANWGKMKFNPSLNTKEFFENDSKGFRRCTSTGGTITGSGGDVIIIDDPINPKQGASEKERKAAIDYFTQTLSTRLNDPKRGLYIVIMQRLHEEDLTGYLMKNMPDKFEFICIPAEETEDVRPITLKNYYSDGLYFPQRHDRLFLDDQRVALGSQGYSGQYLQSPRGEGGNLVNGSWFGRFSLSELSPGVVWHFVIDPAYTEKSINDPSAILAFAFYKGNFYIRNVVERWLDFPRLLQFIRQFVYQNGYGKSSKIYIEPKASGLSAAQSLHANTGLNVIIDKAPTIDKISRLDAVAPMIEAGRVYLLEGAQWIQGFIDQVELFPNSKHDDMVDCLSMALLKGRVFSNKSPKSKLI